MLFATLRFMRFLKTGDYIFPKVTGLSTPRLEAANYLMNIIGVNQKRAALRGGLSGLVRFSQTTSPDTINYF